MSAATGTRVNGEQVKLVPHEVIAIGRLPNCDFDCDQPAEYDFATRFGPWANGCERHYRQHRASGRLGTGAGQMLVARDTVVQA